MTAKQMRKVSSWLGRIGIVFVLAAIIPWPALIPIGVLAIPLLLAAIKLEDKHVDRKEEEREFKEKLENTLCLRYATWSLKGLSASMLSSGERAQLLRNGFSNADHIIGTNVRVT